LDWGNAVNNVDVLRRKKKGSLYARRRARRETVKKSRQGGGEVILVPLALSFLEDKKEPLSSFRGDEQPLCPKKKKKGRSHSIDEEHSQAFLIGAAGGKLGKNKLTRIERGGGGVARRSRPLIKKKGSWRERDERL